MIEPVVEGEAFFKDVLQAGEDGATFSLWWLGQSGFLVKWGRRSLLFDPYLSDSLTRKYAQTDKPHVRMSRSPCRAEQLRFVDLVTSSHNHTDHLDAETLVPILMSPLGLLDRGDPPLLVAPSANRQFVSERLRGVDPRQLDWLDVGQRLRYADFELTPVPAAHETLDRDEQGRLKQVGYVAGFGEWNVYHSGDTVLYDGMVETLRPFHIDVAILPINGRAPERRVAGNLNGKEAAWLAKEIGARLVIPCHYDMFEFNTASPDEFVAECERLGQPYRVLRMGERWSSSELKSGGSEEPGASATPSASGFEGTEP